MTNLKPAFDGIALCNDNALQDKAITAILRLEAKRIRQEKHGLIPRELPLQFDTYEVLNISDRD
tara:strand:+ start:335 stop:526 length:192 start_codon:yes stop_codon:yes gene_type:complete